MKRKFLTYLKLFTAATIVIHLSNLVIAASAELLDKLEHSKNNHKYHWRFGDIFYTQKGTGSPLLLIHDLTSGGSGYEWSRVEDQLAESHTVYTIDLLGCGRSDKPALTYTNFFYVQMISDFIQNVIKEKAEVMTSGYSGSLAVMTAIYNKEVIHSISMVNPTDPSLLAKAPGTKEHYIRNLLMTPVFGTLIYNIAFCHQNIDNEFTENYYFNPFHIDGDVMDAYYEAAHKGGANGKYLYASLAGRYTSINLLPALAQLDIPVTLIMGSCINNIDSITEQYNNLLSNVSTKYIDKCKHYPHIENYKDFLGKLTF